MFELRVIHKTLDNFRNLRTNLKVSVCNGNGGASECLDTYSLLKIRFVTWDCGSWKSETSEQFGRKGVRTSESTTIFLIFKSYPCVQPDLRLNFLLFFPDDVTKLLQTIK